MRIVETANPGAVADMAMSYLPPPDAFNYFQEQFNQFVNTVSQYSNAFVDRVKQMHQTFTNIDVVQKAKEIITRGKTTIYDDRIYSVDASNMHNAGWMMREYIMAQPKLFTMYQNNRLSGWDDQVYLPEDKVDPYWRDDYLYAIDGVWQFEDDGAIAKWYSGEDDNPFTISERVVINNAWETALEILAAGIDPTDPNKSKI